MFSTENGNEKRYAMCNPDEEKWQKQAREFVVGDHLSGGYDEGGGGTHRKFGSLPRSQKERRRCWIYVS